MGTDGPDRQAGARILVVDDEPHIVELVRYNLTHAGFTVEGASDGPDALERAGANPPDLVILDLMLPGVDGLEVCRRLRREGVVPILILTAKGSEHDRVLGFEAGADDYVTKPFSPRELVARVRAILRRAGPDGGCEAEAPLSSGRLTLNAAAHEARLGEHLLDLTPKEFALLHFLMRHPDQLITRDILLERVWGDDYIGGTRTLDMHMSRLREKLGDDPDAPTFIATSRGIGYKLLKQDAMLG